MIVHRKAIKQLTNPTNYNSIKEFNEDFIRFVKPASVSSLQMPYHYEEHLYFTWLDNLAKGTIYFINFDLLLGNISIVGRNMKVVAEIRFCSTFEPLVYKSMPNLKKGIELIHLHSLQKGEGKKLLSEILEAAKKINVPIFLYTETKANTSYFCQFGFKVLGKVKSGEEMLVFVP